MIVFHREGVRVTSVSDSPLGPENGSCRSLLCHEREKVDGLGLVTVSCRRLRLLTLFLFSEYFIMDFTGPKLLFLCE